MNEFRSFPTAICALILAGALSAFAQESPIDALLESNAKDTRLDISLIDAVFDQEILDTKNIDKAIVSFEEAAADEENADHERVKSFLTIAHLKWQFGQRDEAMEAVENALTLGETTDGTLLKARLLDSGGDETAATVWYFKAEASTDSEDEREFIRIRLTMMDVDRQEVDALVELAEQRDQAFKNRAAITLAILGHPEKALDLYLPDPESDYYFRQLVRVAEWALKAGDNAKAQRVAWLAYDATEIRFDALYALTLVDEAYRNEDKMDELVGILEQRGVDDEDLLNLRIDLLIDLERYDDAVDLFNAINQDTSDVEARLRLIQIYDTAGKSKEMVAEYERLIEKEPTIVQWYVALASYYINIAEPDQAAAVWELFEEKNRDRVDVLVRGGEFMNQMGYVDEATSMIDRHAEVHGPTVFGNVFLFETYFARGQDEEANHALEELAAHLPGDSSDLRIVADSFERLRKYEKALDVYLAIEEHEGKLSYDDRMRLAWLHSVVGNKDIALKLWQDIWVTEESPARRSFAEGQFLLIAAELNVLADLVVELEGKLYDKDANKNDINLLVRIYTEVGDAFSATEIVEDFAKYGEMTEVERLRQLGLVYLQLQEYSKYDEVLRQLEKIDPDNRIEHIQNLVLNMLAYDLAEGSNDRYEDIQHWLDELRGYDSDAVTGEFEASVLSMGGFTAEAIESYRRALIDEPTHSDNLLLMADLMKESERTDEAVALLQYVAEHAADDNEFVVAVDGIINMVGQRTFFQQLASEVEATFRWTHRVILERITSREDKFYLYSLLAEIAQETMDREAEFVAIENSVSQAGIRRLAVLREIVTMATPNAGFFSMYQNAGDEDRQLTYGRRLIGLRQQLPPEVYISIARTLLSKGETIGAEKSLSLVRDITGQIDVNKTKADLFHAEGYDREALASYSQALSVNRDSLELQFKTAALREGIGQFDVANALYASAMLKVLRGLPTALQAASREDRMAQAARMGVLSTGMMMTVSMGGSHVDTSVTHDYRTFYEMLIQGLIATWPDDQQLSDSKLNVFRTEVDEALATVVKQMADEASESEEETSEVLTHEEGKKPFDPKRSITRFSRLSYTAQMIRRLCSAIDLLDESEEMDLELAKHFGDDPNFQGQVLGHYETLGMEPSEKLVAVFKDDEEVEEEESPPEDRSRVEQALENAISSQQIGRVARLSNIMETPKPLHQLLRDYITTTKQFRTGLQYASAALDENDYTRVLNAAVPLLQEEPANLVMFMIDGPDFFIEIEDQVGESLVTLDEEFMRDSEVQRVVRGYYNAVPAIWYYIKERGAISDLISLFETVVKGIQPTQFPSAMQMDIYGLHKDLLSKPLDEELQTRVLEATTDMMQATAKQDEFIQRYATELVFNFEVDPANVDTYKQIVEDHQLILKGSEKIGELVNTYYSGDEQGAYRMLLEMYTEDPNLSFYSGDALFKAFRDQYIESLNELREGNVDDLELTKMLLNVGPRYAEPDPEMDLTSDERLEIYEKLVERYPEEKEFLLYLIYTQVNAHERENLMKYLRTYYELDNTEEFMRTAYYLTAVENENYDLALSIALDGGSDLRYQEVREEIYERSETAAQMGPMETGSILLMIRGLDPYDTITRMVGGVGGIEKAVARMQEIVASDDVDPEEIPLLLRRLWRGTQAAGLGDQMRNFYGNQSVIPMLLQWPSTGTPSPNVMYMSIGLPLASAGGSLRQRLNPGQDEDAEEQPTLLELLISKAPLGRDFELLLMSLQPYERKNSSQVYSLVAQAYIAFPQSLEARMPELSERLVANVANEHEFTLWMTLVRESDASVSQEEADALVSKSRDLQAPTDDQLLSIAELLAQQGYNEEAVDCYESLMIRTIDYSEFTDQRGRIYYGPNMGIPMDAMTLLESANEHLSHEYAARFASRMMSYLRPVGDSPEIEQLYQAFLLRGLSVVHDPSDVVDIAKEWSPDIDETVDVVESFDGIRLIHLGRVFNRAGDFDRSATYTKALFSKLSIESKPSVEETGFINVRMMGNAMYQLMNTLQTVGTTFGLSLPNVGPSLSFGPMDEEPLPTGASMYISLLDESIDFDNAASVDATVANLASWLDEPEFSVQVLLEAIATISFICFERGDPDRARAVASVMQDWLLSQDLETLDSRTLSSFTLIVPVIDFVVDPQIVRTMFELQILSQQQSYELLQALSEQESGSDLLGAAKLLDTEFAGLGVLREIRDIALEAGEAEYAQELDARILVLENAYESIELVGGFDEVTESS